MWYLPGQGSLMSLPSWCHHPHFDFTSPLICFPCPWTSHKSYKHICLFVSRWFCLSKIQPGGSPRVASVESTPNLPVHNPWGKAPVLTFSYTCPHPSSGKERSSRESWALKATDDQGSQASRFPYLDKEHQLPWGSHKSFYHCVEFGAEDGWRCDERAVFHQITYRMHAGSPWRRALLSWFFISDRGVPSCYLT